MNGSYHSFGSLTSSMFSVAEARVARAVPVALQMIVV